MTDKHTPGPWTVLSGTYEKGTQRKIVGLRTAPFYVLVAGSPNLDANARLIALAPFIPDLKRELERSQQYIGKLIADNDWEGQESPSFVYFAKQQLEANTTLLSRINSKGGE